MRYLPKRTHRYTRWFPFGHPFLTFPLRLPNNSETAIFIVLFPSIASRTPLENVEFHGTGSFLYREREESFFHACWGLVPDSFERRCEDKYGKRGILEEIKDESKRARRGEIWTLKRLRGTSSSRTHPRDAGDVPAGRITKLISRPRNSTSRQENPTSPISLRPSNPRAGVASCSWLLVLREARGDPI